MNTVVVVNLGLTDFRSAWDLQKAVYARRIAGSIPDVLLLNEHSHVYTFGKNSDPDHLLASADELRSKGIDVCAIDRGGDVTYHGPGQLVVYPILRLENYYRDVHRYLRDLEEVMIRTLADFGIEGHRDEGFTGAWVGREKVGAIGVKVSHWTTMHGFAFNTNSDLSYFDRIIPCGIFHKGVTSLQRLMGKSVPMTEVADRVCRNFASVFGVELTDRIPEELSSLLPTPTKVIVCEAVEE